MYVCVEICFIISSIFNKIARKFLWDDTAPHFGCLEGVQRLDAGTDHRQSMEGGLQHLCGHAIRVDAQASECSKQGTSRATKMGKMVGK